MKRFSIVFASEPAGPCASCGKPVGQGPVGRRDQEFLCDSCMSEEHPQLSLALFAILMMREMGQLPPGSTEELRSMLAFAQTYDLLSPWPPRASSLLKELQRREGGSRAREGLWLPRN